MLQLILETVQALGPWGPVAFVAAVAVLECVPLFPTQPFSLASGLLFGMAGAGYVFVGTMVAAVAAFLLARGVGRPWAERMVHEELKDGASAGPISKALIKVEDAISQDSFIHQATGGEWPLALLVGHAAAGAAAPAASDPLTLVARLPQAFSCCA